MKISLLRTISLVAFLGATTPAMAADPVVAKVDGQTYTYSQVMETKSDLPKQYQSAPDDKLFPVLLNQMVDNYLINKAAQESGIAKTPEVEKNIAKATEGIVAQAFLLSKVKDSITDTAVKAKYDEVIKKFPEEKEAHIRHILVDNKETAIAVIKALNNNGDFKKLAQAKSKDSTASEGGDLGWLRKSELPQELGEAAFALKPGTFSQEPIKTDFGWHVLYVEEIRDAKPPKFDEVKNELKTLMTQEAILALVKELRKNSKVELFDKDGKPLPLEPEKKPEADAPDAPAPAAPKK
jgi:peptidyl-prolyl cis-trans isomerase C